MKVIIGIIFAIAIIQPSIINAAKILGFFAAPGRSHLIVHTSLTNALANRGHEVFFAFEIKLINR